MYSAVLAQNVRFLRGRRNLTQTEFAALCGISWRIFQKIEGGTANPTVSTLLKIADALHMTPDQLLRLSVLRLKISDEEFLLRFSSRFDSQSLGAGVRTVDGDAYYANRSLQSMLRGREFSPDHPVSLMRILRGPARETLRHQLSSERNGVIGPYINYMEAPDGERIYLRYNPTVIFPKNGSNGHFVAIYATYPELDSQESYLEFCRILLDAAGV